MDGAVAAAIGDGDPLKLDKGVVKALVRGGRSRTRRLGGRHAHAALSRRGGTIAAMVSSAWRTAGGGMC